MDRAGKYLHKYRFILGGAIIAAAISLLSLLPPIPNQSPLHSTANTQKTVSATRSRPPIHHNDPNVVSAGLATLASGLATFASSAGDTSSHIIQTCSLGIYTGIRTVGVFTARSVGLVIAAVAKGVALTVRGLVSGIALIGHSIINSVIFTVHATGGAIGTFASIPAISNVLQPQGGGETPVITAELASLSLEHVHAHELESVEVLSSQHPEPAPANLSGTESVWPVQGRVTTKFGVPHWPFQPTHTGMDVSSGNRSGATPVKAFKAGTVIETIHSRYGFGNHVILDHGNGMTSLYAHLDSIAVVVGEEVNAYTILGREGTTGTSTGTHLHFEIRVDGQPVNPLPYLSQ